MTSNFNIAQCLLNGRSYTPEQLQQIMKEGEQDEAALVRMMPEVSVIDPRPVRTAVMRAADGAWEDRIEWYSRYAELFIEKLRDMMHTEAVVAQLPSIEEEPAPAHAVFLRIEGDISFVSGLAARDAVFLELARRYSGEPLDTVDEMAVDSIQEFLNVVNGLFCIELANSGMEGELSLPRWRKNVRIQGAKRLCLRIYTSFAAFQLILFADDLF